VSVCVVLRNRRLHCRKRGLKLEKTGRLRLWRGGEKRFSSGSNKYGLTPVDASMERNARTSRNRRRRGEEDPLSGPQKKKISSDPQKKEKKEAQNEGGMLKVHARFRRGEGGKNVSFLVIRQE